jgi:Skp family chaperone for outer membrane proteins
MERKNAFLGKDIIEKLKRIKKAERDVIFDYGQIALEHKNALIYVEQLENELTEIYNKIQVTQNELDGVLTELEKEYPNGEIDLDKGVIYY